MPKLKTKKAAAKRFGVTGTGKLKRNHSFKRHLLFNKPTKQKRQARGSVIIAAANKFIKDAPKDFRTLTYENVEGD